MVKLDIKKVKRLTIWDGLSRREPELLECSAVVVHYFGVVMLLANPCVAMEDKHRITPKSDDIMLHIYLYLFFL